MNELMFKLLDEIQHTEPKDTIYTYNGTKVPRVTHIIEKCMNNQYIVQWANSLGFKRKSYTATLNGYANVGTQCHKSIDNFLNTDDKTVPEDIVEEASYAYQSYLAWYNMLSTQAKKFECIYHEQPISCQWFGGTMDGLYNINGAICLVDYKTSKHISEKHLLQTSAYRYILREIMNIDIKAIIILQLSKNSIYYKEHILNFNIPEQLTIADDYERAFFSLLYAYYNFQIIDKEFSELHWR